MAALLAGAIITLVPSQPAPTQPARAFARWIGNLDAARAIVEAVEGGGRPMRSPTPEDEAEVRQLEEKFRRTTEDIDALLEGIAHANARSKASHSP